MSVKEQIKSLRSELHKHNYNYYVLDDSSISDYDFDLKLKELKELELVSAQPEFKFTNSESGR